MSTTEKLESLLAKARPAPVDRTEIFEVMNIMQDANSRPVWDLIEFGVNDPAEFGVACRAAIRLRDAVNYSPVDTRHPIFSASVQNLVSTPEQARALVQPQADLILALSDNRRTRVAELGLPKPVLGDVIAAERT